LFLRHLDDLRCRLRRYRKVHVICDRAGCHTSDEVAVYLWEHRDRIELHLLPAYSPDCNPIERLFSKLKAALRSAAVRTVDALIEAMGDDLRAIRVSDIRGWFRHSEYPTDSSTVTVNEKPL